MLKSHHGSNSSDDDGGDDGRIMVIVFGRVHFPEPEKINPMIRVALPKLQ